MTRSAVSSVFVSVMLIGLALLAPGCSDDSEPRSVVDVETVNAGQVLDSDVYNNGADKLAGTEDDFILEDQVQIVIRNRPHDSALNIRTNGPFSSVVFERYEIHFQGDETLSPLFGSIHLRIASGATGTGIVTVVPAGYKVMPPLSPLRTGGELRFSAEITLIGYEEDSNDEVRAVATMPVHCANWTDETP
jgi:hypothetical protein